MTHAPFAWTRLIPPLVASGLFSVVIEDHSVLLLRLWCQVRLFESSCGCCIN